MGFRILDSISREASKMLRPPFTVQVHNKPQENWHISHVSKFKSKTKNQKFGHLHILSSTWVPRLARQPESQIPGSLR